MKRFISAFTAAFVAALSVLPGTAAELAPADSNLYIVHFSTGPAWEADVPFPEQQHAQEHSRNLGRLREAGTLLFGGRYGDTGMIVLRTTSEAQARAEIESDPAVQDGVFGFEIAQLTPFFDGCITRSAVESGMGAEASRGVPQENK